MAEEITSVGAKAPSSDIIKVKVLKKIIRGSGIVTGGVITMERKVASPLIKSGHLKEVKEKK